MLAFCVYAEVDLFERGPDRALSPRRSFVIIVTVPPQGYLTTTCSESYNFNKQARKYKCRHTIKKV